METHADLTYLHLRAEPPERRAHLCQAFYQDIYRQAFTHPDQIESPETWLPLMGDVRPAKQPELHMIVACDPGERVVGGIIVERYRPSECWLATYIAVRLEDRGKGVATGLMAEVARTIRLNGRSDWLLFAETENPALVPDAEAAWARTRLQVLTELDMRRVDIEYVQPALAASKRPCRDLFLLCYAQDAPNRTLPAARVMDFLRDFYAALHQQDSAELRRLTSELSHRDNVQTLPLVFARDDSVLGRARSISFRIILFGAHTITPKKPWFRKQPEAQAQEISLKELRQALHEHELEKPLSEAITSYHVDIVSPYATENSRPLVVLCEQVAKSKDDRAALKPITIHVPHKFKMRWEEGRDLIIDFGETECGDHVVSAGFSDSVTFFESGYIAYSLSFVFGSSDRVDINASLLLALESVAKPAGEVSGKPVRFANDGKAPEELDKFINRRLDDLANQSTGVPTIFSLLNCPKRYPLRKSVLSIARRPEWQAHSPVDTGMVGATPPDREFHIHPSIDIEIIGATRHTEILRCAEKARERTAPANAFSKRLAGLVQNVLDFREQDESEICDSLSATSRIGREITFANKDVSVRFSEGSRAYNGMRNIIGGEPYWLLVQLVVGHNETLLSDLHQDVEQLHGKGGMTGMMHELLHLPSRSHSAADTEQRLRKTLERRIRLAHYIPNMFRYKTEKRLYHLFSRARGLEAQHAYFRGLEETVESTVREIEDLNRERASSRITKVLILLGVVQIGGVFAAISAVDHDNFIFFLRHLRWADLERFTYDVTKGPKFFDQIHHERVDALRGVLALYPGLIILAGGIAGLLILAGHALLKNIRRRIRK